MSSVRRNRNERSCPVQIQYRLEACATLVPKAQCSIGFQPVSGVRGGWHVKGRETEALRMWAIGANENRLEAYSTLRFGLSSDVPGLS